MDPHSAQFFVFIFHKPEPMGVDGMTASPDLEKPGSWEVKSTKKPRQASVVRIPQSTSISSQVFPLPAWDPGWCAQWLLSDDQSAGPGLGTRDSKWCFGNSFQALAFETGLVGPGGVIPGTQQVQPLSIAWHLHYVLWSKQPHSRPRV